MYDFVVNDEDEVMLLLYAGKTEPSHPRFVLNTEKGSAELFRTEKESLVLHDIPADVLDSLIDADSLLVCELNDTENEEENRIVYAYEADIED